MRTVLMVMFTVFQDFQKDKRVGDVKPNHAQAERSRQESEYLLSLSHTGSRPSESQPNATRV